MLSTLGNPLKVYSQPGADTPGLYLQKELGIKVRSLQDTNSMLAIQKPADFLKKRDALIKGMFEIATADVVVDGVNLGRGDARVTNHYQKRKAELEALGVPTDKAHQFATDSANKLYEEELKILEYSMPTGYQQAFSTVAINHNAEVKKADVADFDREAYKKKLKAKYKQKYNK